MKQGHRVVGRRIDNETGAGDRQRHRQRLSCDLVGAVQEVRRVIRINRDDYGTICRAHAADADVRSRTWFGSAALHLGGASARTSQQAEPSARMRQINAAGSECLVRRHTRYEAGLSHGSLAADRVRFQEELPMIRFAGLLVTAGSASWLIGGQSIVPGISPNGFARRLTSLPQMADCHRRCLVSRDESLCLRYRPRQHPARPGDRDQQCVTLPSSAITCSKSRNRSSRSRASTCAAPAVVSWKAAFWQSARGGGNHSPCRTSIPLSAAVCRLADDHPGPGP